MDRSTSQAEALASAINYLKKLARDFKLLQFTSGKGGIKYYPTESSNAHDLMISTVSSGGSIFGMFEVEWTSDDQEDCYADLSATIRLDSATGTEIDDRYITRSYLTSLINNRRKVGYKISVSYPSTTNRNLYVKVLFSGTDMGTFVIRNTT